MVFYVESKTPMMVQEMGCSVGNVRTYYTWLTPFQTEDEAKEHKKFLEEESRAVSVEIIGHAEYQV